MPASYHAFINRSWQITLLLAVLLAPGVWAESPHFVIQEVKHGEHRPAEPQLDLPPERPIQKQVLRAQEKIQRVIPSPKQDPPKRYVAQHGIIGLDLSIAASRYPMVQSVFRNTPAYNRGILPGDIIVAVNGQSTLGKSRPDVDDMISDIPGEQVVFTIARGQELKQMSVVVMALDETSGGLQASFAEMYP